MKTLIPAAIRCSLMFIAVAALSIVYPTSVQAVSTTYQYTGNPSSHADGFYYTTSDFVTAMVTLPSPLGPNMPLTQVTPTAFTFSAGRLTISNRNAYFSIFRFATDVSGAITSWYVPAGIPYNPSILGGQPSATLSGNILTPAGYKNISDLHVGDEVLGYDCSGKGQVTNKIEKIESVAPSQYPLPFIFYKINDRYEFFQDQSVFAGGGLVHAHELVLGNSIKTKTGQNVIITKVESLVGTRPWVKFTVSGNHTYIEDELILHNASRYWVGGGSSSNWNATQKTNWSATSGGSNNASVPTTSDSVFFDGVGGGASDSTISANITINVLDMTGYVNTLTHNASVTLTISGNTFKLASGMTYSLGNGKTSAISLTSTSGTPGSPTAITTRGKTLGNLTINASTGGYFSLQDNLTIGSTATLTLTKGTFDANNKNVSVGLFSSSNSNARTVKMGSGTWTLSGSSGTIWTTSTITGLTFTRGSAIVASANASSGTRIINPGALAESSAPSFSITAGSDRISISSGKRVLNLDFTGFSGTYTNSVLTVYGNLTFSSGMTLGDSTATITMAATSGTKTITTNGKTVNLPIKLNGPGGTFQLADSLIMGSANGTLTITAGTLRIPSTLTTKVPAFTNSGTILVASGVTWTLGAGSYLTNRGTITHNGNGWILDNYSSVINRPINSSPATITYSGTAITSKGTFGQFGTFDLTGKTLTFSGATGMVGCTGTLGGTVVISMTGGSFVVGTGCTISLGNTPTTAVGTHITNNGTINVAGGAWSNTFNSNDSNAPLVAPFAITGLIPSDNWTMGFLAPNGKIYGIPESGTTILIIDPALGTITTSTMGASIPAAGTKWIGGALGPDGKIYGIPYAATSILIIDPASGTATTSTMGADLSGGNKWVGGALGPDGKIYGMPSTAADILIIDPASGTATRSSMGASIPAGPSTGKWHSAALGPDGKIYGIPASAESILIIDPSAGTATTSTMGASIPAGLKWVGAVLGPDGKIYGIPGSAESILIIDPSAGTATTSTMGADLSGEHKWENGILGSDGKIYGVPRDTVNFLVIDPATGTATLDNLGTELPMTTNERYHGVAADSNGNLYFIPSKAGNVQVLTFGIGPVFSNNGTINHSGTSWSVDSNFTNAGVVSSAGTSMAVSGNFTFSSGTFTAPSSLSVSGDFNNSGGTFSSNSGTVILNGTNQTISGSTTFYNLAKMASVAETLTFEAGKTQTIANGLTLQGTSGQTLSLRSSSVGTQWNFDPQGTRTIGYLDVEDSENINATAINATNLNITDSGNNTGWIFR